MRRAVAGVLQLALVGAIVGGLSLPVAYALGYFRGKAVTAAERNAHWQAMFDRREAQQRAAAAARDAEVRQAHQAITKERDDAQAKLERESATVRALRGDLARAGREHDRLREQLAGAAAGGVAEADDSVAACRARADAFGQLLGEALRTSSACAVDAEDLAAGSRALRQYGQRAHELSQEAP